MEYSFAITHNHIVMIQDKLYRKLDEINRSDLRIELEGIIKELGTPADISTKP